MQTSPSMRAGGAKFAALGEITEEHYDALVNSEVAEEVMNGISKTVPLGRFGTPDEVAKAVVFLASDDAATSREQNCSWMAASPKCSPLAR